MLTIDALTLVLMMTAIILTVYWATRLLHINDELGERKAIIKALRHLSEDQRTGEMPLPLQEIDVAAVRASTFSEVDRSISNLRLVTTGGKAGMAVTMLFGFVSLLSFGSIPDNVIVGGDFVAFYLIIFFLLFMAQVLLLYQSSFAVAASLKELEAEGYAPMKVQLGKYYERVNEQANARPVSSVADYLAMNK